MCTETEKRNGKEYENKNETKKVRTENVGR
jgi:hypothetical protein